MSQLGLSHLFDIKILHKQICLRTFLPNIPPSVQRFSNHNSYLESKYWCWLRGGVQDARVAGVAAGVSPQPRPGCAARPRADRRLQHCRAQFD